MRRWVFIASCVVVARLAATLLGMAPPVIAVNAVNAQPQMWFEVPGDYYMRSDASITAEQLRGQIGGILDMSRSPGMDDWAWHGAVEDQLVSFGERLPRAVPLIWQAAETRKGFEADALEVAAFRLENSGINPRAVVADWAAHRPGAANDPAKAAKVARVMGLMNLFPHHLFYTVESRGSGTPDRVVVAVAADSKVQVISEDAALTRFMRVELPPLNSDAARDQAAETAALLALARFINIYQPEQVAATADPQIWIGEGGNARVRTRVIFDSAGHVATVNVMAERLAAPESHPAAVPNPSAPPAMPD